MNRERRRQLRQWNAKIEALKSELENILCDEQDCYDNIPENLQGSSRAMDSEEAIEQMEEAIEIVDEVIEAIDNIV